MVNINRAPLKPHDGNRLFVKISSKAALQRGWEKVFDNHGAHGGDGVSCTGFARLARQRIEALSNTLKDGSYVPGPLRRVAIAKPSGGERVLNIPCIADRVVQTSVAQALSPLFEAEFEHISYGYRPGRSVKQALLELQRARNDGFIWTVDADIEAFFDSVPHERMMQRFLISVSDSALSDLVALWLESASPTGRGLAQGSPLSPLLANLYLDTLDEALLRKHMRVIRFADDFVVLTRKRQGADEALEDVRRALADLGLVLHAGKTRIRSYDDTLKYLGTVFVRSMIIRNPESVDQEDMNLLLRRQGLRDEQEEEAAQKAGQSEAAEKHAGYHRGVRTLYIHEAGRRLGLANLSFKVSAPGESRDDEPTLLAAVHPTRLDRLEIGPHVHVEDEALRNALSFGITVNFVNGHGETQGTLTPPIAQRGHRHLAQARHCLDGELRLVLARIFVDGRLRNQRALLRRINQRRKITDVAKRTTAISRHIRLAQMARDLDALRGHEGAATAHYWKAFRQLLLHGWGFERRRRPAPDPVNAVLNLTASLLTRDVAVMVERAGLHPCFGTLHATSDGRDACVYDLIEIFRAPIAESVTLDLFNTKMLRAEHFDKYEKGFRMNRFGVRSVIRGYEERVENLVRSQKSGNKMSWRMLIGEQAMALAAHYEDRAPFEPYLLDY